MRIGFRPVGAADLPMLRDWIAQHHWQEWWGDPDEEVGHIRAMVEGRDSSIPALIEVDGAPAGYIQHWFVRDQVAEWGGTYPWLALLPEEAVGVDLSLADAERLGQGMGSAALALYVARLRGAGHRVIVIDPDAANARAVRAYRRAGFRPVPEFEGRTGDVLIMRHEGEGDGRP